MNWSLAELRRRLAANPEVTLESPLDATSDVVSAAVRELNPDTAAALTKPYDTADELMEQIRIHDPKILHLFVRDMPFETFRVDIAVPVSMIAIEVDGGQHKPGGGKHGGKRDYYKTRRIVRAGWRLYRFTAGEVRDDPLAVIDEIREALRS